MKCSICKTNAAKWEWRPIEHEPNHYAYTVPGPRDRGYTGLIFCASCQRKMIRGELEGPFTMRLYMISENGTHQPDIGE